MTSVTLRPRIGGYVGGAMMMTAVAYFVLLLVGTKATMPDYPFAFAALIGGGNLLWNLVVHARRHGLRMDENGVIDLHSNVVMRWDQIDAIRLDIEQVALGGGHQAALRIATLVAGDRTIRFADIGPGRSPRVGTVVNLETAPLALAMAAGRTNARALFPETWTATAEAAAPDEARAPASGVRRRWRLEQLGGVAALAIKVGPKLVTMIVKLVKSIKVGSVAVTVGAYALIWSWEFAVALVGMVLVHECGHVFAMWRSGVGVRGIYFIPFFGGAAVSKGIARTRAKAAYIALNGPIWGMLLALGCLAGFALGLGGDLLLALAAWGAVLNLFNLLPIFPLDGGRIVASLAHASPRGVPIVAASLVLGAGVAYFAQLELLLLVGVLGLFEFGNRVAAATYGPALRLLDRALSPADHEQFSRHVAYIEPGRDAPARVEARMELFAARKAEAEQTPMTLRQGALTLAGYFAVVGVLVAILYVAAAISGTAGPLALLR